MHTAVSGNAGQTRLYSRCGALCAHQELAVFKPLLELEEQLGDYLLSFKSEKKMNKIKFRSADFFFSEYFLALRGNRVALSGFLDEHQSNS